MKRNVNVLNCFDPCRVWIPVPRLAKKSIQNKKCSVHLWSPNTVFTINTKQITKEVHNYMCRDIHIILNKIRNNRLKIEREKRNFALHYLVRILSEESEHFIISQLWFRMLCQVKWRLYLKSSEFSKKSRFLINHELTTSTKVH